MSKAIANRKVQVSTPAPSAGLIIGLIVVGLLIWYLMKKNSQPAGQYLNEEKWDVKYSEDGLPTSITIHRNATRS